MARPTSARIRPGIDLNRIVINLDRNLPPTMEMHGRIVTGNRQVDQASTVTIKTMTLDREGVDFVLHIKDVFSAGLGMPAGDKG